MFWAIFCQLHNPSIFQNISAVNTLRSVVQHAVITVLCSLTPKSTSGQHTNITTTGNIYIFF